MDYVTAYERFGGFMLWDASFDQQSEENGQTYFQYLMDLVDADLASPDTGTVDTTEPEDSTGENNPPSISGCSPGLQDLGNISIELTSTSQWETGQSVSAVLTNLSSTALTHVSWSWKTQTPFYRSGT